MSPNGREALEGFLLVQKPCGPTSFQVVKKVRGISGVKRVGHCGTLDPFASGLLILGLGRRFTRQLDAFQALTKTYTGTMVLGMETDTYDVDGNVTYKVQPERCPEPDQIREVFAQFIGEISQIPPNFSAKKVDGKRAYDLARKGIAVELKPQLVRIDDFVLHKAHKKPFPELDFTVTCSRGTYIRTLANDIGKALKTGAYLDRLARVAIGNYPLQEAIAYPNLTVETIQSGLFRKPLDPQ